MMTAPAVRAEQNVALGDRADAAVDHFDLHFAGRQTDECVGECFRRTALVRLDDDVQRVRDARRGLRHEVLERDATARSATTARFAIETFAALRDITRGRRIFDDEQLIAGHRHALESEDLHRNRRTCRLHRLAALVEQRANAAGVHAADEVVADLERAALHEHRGDRTLARVQLRFDDRAGRAPIRIRLEVENFGLQQNLIEQHVDVRSLLRRDLRRQRRSAELFEHDAVLQQLLLHFVRVRLRQIDLVDGDDERHAGVLGVRDRFDRLRHDRIVRGDDEDDDVRDLRAARTHGRECFVARRVEERDVLAVRQRDVIRADVLRDATRFAGDDVRFANVVEQRRLSVIDVAHDRDDRRTPQPILGKIRRRRRRLSPPPDTHLRERPGIRTRPRSTRSGRSRDAD